MSTWITFKAWVDMEADKWKVRRHSILDWFYQGLYPSLNRRIKNKRVIMVKMPSPEKISNVPELSTPMKEWVSDEAERVGVTTEAIRVRLWRGKYPNVEVLSSGRGHVAYVRIKQSHEQ